MTIYYALFSTEVNDTYIDNLDRLVGNSNKPITKNILDFGQEIHDSFSINFNEDFNSHYGHYPSKSLKVTVNVFIDPDMIDDLLKSEIPPIYICEYSDGLIEKLRLANSLYLAEFNKKIRDDVALMNFALEIKRILSLVEIKSLSNYDFLNIAA